MERQFLQELEVLADLKRRHDVFEIRRVHIHTVIRRPLDLVILGVVSIMKSFCSLVRICDQLVGRLLYDFQILSLLFV